MDKDIAIKIRNVTKTYQLYNSHADRVKEAFHPLRKKYHRPFNALTNVSFQVEKGESIGIIGRNGSGKSTLLQIICGILLPSLGNVEINGRISALLELGAGFNPEFTGRENVYLSASILGFSKEEIDNKFDEIEAFADIGEFIDQPVKIYSSGMAVRLAFAVQVNIEPKILIIDEVIAVGDIFFQQKCARHMKEVMSNCTIVFVTHDMHSVTNLCDRVIVLDSGEIVFEGSPLEGVSTFTKIIHNQLFHMENEASSVNKQQEPGLLNNVNDLSTDNWTNVPDDAKAGSREVEIISAKITSKDFRSINSVQPDEPVVVHMLVHSSKEKEYMIFGYTVKDRVGNAIFGENTCDYTKRNICLSAGNCIVRMEFKWPEIYPDQYTITLGIGEGTDPFVHTIQCWAHNILSISAITPGINIHGMFNCPLTDFAITRVKG